MIRELITILFIIGPILGNCSISIAPMHSSGENVPFPPSGWFSTTLQGTYIETSELKWVKPEINIVGVNSVRHGVFYIMPCIYKRCLKRHISSTSMWYQSGKLIRGNSDTIFPLRYCKFYIKYGRNSRKKHGISKVSGDSKRFYWNIKTRNDIKFDWILHKIK